MDYWNSGEYFSFLSHRNGGVSSFGSDYCPARQTQTNPLLSRATVSLTFMSPDSKFCVGSWVWQETLEGQMIYQPKRFEYNNKDEDDNLKTLNDKNHQASSQKFRLLMRKHCYDECNAKNNTWTHSMASHCWLSNPKEEIAYLCTISSTLTFNLYQDRTTTSWNV